MNILSLDLGTTTGWAFRRDGKLRAGSILLATEKALAIQRKVRGDRRGDARIQALWEFMEDTEESVGAFDALVFEDVRFIRSTAQGQLWPSLRTVVWLYGYMHERVVECLDTGKLKIFATGYGAATKEMMAAALAKGYPELVTVRTKGTVLTLIDTDTILDDNAVDATHLLLWAEKILKK